MYNVSYDEFLAAFKVVDSICKQEGWTIDSMTYAETFDSKGMGSPGVAGISKTGNTSSASALASQTPITATGNAGNHLPRVRNFRSTPNQGLLSGGNDHKTNGAALAGSPERKTNTNSTPSRRY